MTEFDATQAADVAWLPSSAMAAENKVQMKR